jgi:DNA-binding GntR family transcriptional regulator
MEQQEKEKRKPLHRRVREHLIERIRGMRPGANRLETEEALAERLGTSRATVREAMASLIREGYVTRKQGKGSFGHPGIAGLQMRIDMNSDFRRLIRSSGGRVYVNRSPAVITTPSAQMLRRMPEARQDQVVAFDWNYRDGEEQVINCRVELLRHLMKEVPDHEAETGRGETPEGEEAGPEESAPHLAEFIERYCEVEITYTATWLRSEISPEIAERFGVDPGRPMVVWDEIFFDLYDRRICFNTIHFHPDRMDLSMRTHF